MPRRRRTPRATRRRAGRSMRRACRSPTRTRRDWPTASRPRSGWARGSSSSRPCRGTGRSPSSRSAATRRSSPARTTGSRWTSSSRATSASTRPTAPARRAPASGTRLEIDPDLLIPDKSKSLRDGRPRAVGPAADGGVVALEDPRGDLQGARLGLRRAGPEPAARGDGLPPPRAEGRAGRHRATATSAARTRTRRRSRASSTTSSGATARPTRSTSRPSSRSTWSRGPVPPAAARSSSPGRWR